MIEKKAFTLIELLVVIAIIAVLVALLLPALSRARKVTHAAQSLSNLRQISMALLTHANDHKGWLPDHGAIAGNPDPSKPDGYDTPEWGRQIPFTWATKYGTLARGGYLNDYKLWLDPGDGTMREGYRRPQHPLEPADNSDRHMDPNFYTYSYTMMAHLQRDDGSARGWSNNFKPDKLANFVQPSKDMAFGEENTWYSELTSVAINDAGFNGDWTEPRHFGMSQAGFLDGRAETVEANIRPMLMKEWNRHMRYD